MVGPWKGSVMANILAIGGLGAAIIAGAVSQLTGGGKPAQVPGWLGLPAGAEVAIKTASAAHGQLDLRFDGPSDDLVAQLQSNLTRHGFVVSEPAAAAGDMNAVAHDFAAQQAQPGRGVTIRVIELSDHDEWHVTYWDKAAS